MLLSPEQEAMLAGKYGRATKKSMEILLALGTIYGAERLIPVSSVQISGVSYDNLGEAGLQFLAEMVDGGGVVRVLTTLNPAGMDIQNWQSLGIPQDFARDQQRVIDAFARMEVITTCTCTPYLAGNLPHFGEHIAWAESSAVCFANSVIGARTNREGGPSALAAALTGYTPEYGLHLDDARQPTITFNLSHLEFDKDQSSNTHSWGALGKAIGERLQILPGQQVPYITGISNVTLEELKSFCASIGTYGGTALFHIDGITPESSQFKPTAPEIIINPADLEQAIQSLSNAEPTEVDFISLGCPHLSIQEIAQIARLLQGKRVVKEFWITTSRPAKQIADQMGYTSTIEQSGAKFAVDTCCVVAPIRSRFNALATDSAKACYYAYPKNRMKTLFKPFDQVVQEALGEKNT